MQRRRLLQGSAAWLAAAPRSPAEAANEPRKPNTLRVAFNVAETGFDPPQIGDTNSFYVAASIFEPPLTYDYLTRPVKLKPLTAVALPEISADFTRFRFRIRPGLFFADDPAFKGKKRELVAQDYVYSVKRYYDPKLNAEAVYQFENAKVLGLSELRDAARRGKTAFDYDRDVEGIRALDRYTFEVRLGAPNPRFAFVFATAYAGAVAREVVQSYGDDIAAHPVGTGPFKLESWRRASRIVLLRNPGFRKQLFEGEPAVGDVQAQRIAEELAGKQLPRLDRIEISVITEVQPRWLAFLEGALDLLELPNEFVPAALPNDRLAAHLERKAIRHQRALQADMSLVYFNMRDATVGGNEPGKVALRRAVGLGFDGDDFNRVVRNGQAIAAQSTIPPFTSGYVESYRSEMSKHSRAEAAALLDVFGYVDANGDGWRERPDGTPLVLRMASLPDQRSRRQNELWRKYLAAVGVRMEFDVATWPDLLKKARAGSLMMWGYSWAAGSPDGSFFLGIGYGPNASESNDAFFNLPEFDRLFERQFSLPDGAERDAVMRQAKNLLVAYMPYKATGHNIVNDLQQPWVRGHWRHPFMRDAWRYVGVDAPLA